MRIEGWEQQLDSLIEGARHRPYSLGGHDCFTLSCAVVRALTGQTRGLEFIGQYEDKAQALELINRHGQSFEAAFEWCFGMKRKPTAAASRGDLMVVRLGEEKHLAVCLGVQMACLAEDGLIFLPVEMAHCAFDVQCPHQ